MNRTRQPHLAFAFLALITACASPPPTDSDSLVASMPRPVPDEHPVRMLLEQGYSAAYLPICLEGGSVVVAGAGGGLELAELGPLTEVLGERSEPFLLVLRVTAEPEQVYAALQPILRRHVEALVRYESGDVLDGALQVVLAGAIPLDELAAERTRYAFAAGGLGVLDERYSPALVPIVRARYEELLEWRGDGPLPEVQRLRVQAVAARAHGQGRTLIVRNVPEDERVWETLLVSGVDRIEIGAIDSRAAKRFARFLGERSRSR